jgi:2-polyprenyl-6-methoxyphenol hydroxylase-like FAD-dependent oxidoreductase
LRIDREGALMSKPRLDHAIVIGSGISGLATAAALAGFFERVTVVERDELGFEPAVRPGTPQSRHLHGILPGGLLALGELFPGFDRYLAEAGAVPVRVAVDSRMEFPGYDPFPPRDFGWIGYTMSRPLIEHVMRQRVRKQANVMLLDRCRVLELAVDDDGSVNGISCAPVDGPARHLRADLVVDASGRGSLTSALLKAMRLPQPERTEIGIDMNYATGTFSAAESTVDWKMAITYPDNPRGKTGYVFAIEGGRWMSIVGERHVAMPSDSVDGFLDMARQLRTSTIYDTLRHAKPLDKIHRFNFPESSWRHYERMDAFPRGLLPIGDAICRFNPIHGQGMAVAAKEAAILQDLLQTRTATSDPLDGLAPAFFAAVNPLIAAAWSMSAVPDFAHPETRGVAPDDLQDSLHFAKALMRLAARDPAVHELMFAARYLMKPPSVLRDPELVRRVQAEMADA